MATKTDIVIRLSSRLPPTHRRHVVTKLRCSIHDNVQEEAAYTIIRAPLSDDTLSSAINLIRWLLTTLQVTGDFDVQLGEHELTPVEVEALLKSEPRTIRELDKVLNAVSR